MNTFRDSAPACVASDYGLRRDATWLDEYRLRAAPAPRAGFWAWLADLRWRVWL